MESFKSFLCIYLFLAGIATIATGQNLSLELCNARLPSGRGNIGAMYDGGDTIYLFGGKLENSAFTNQIVKYSISEDTTQTAGSLPRETPFGNNNPLAINSEGKIFTFGVALWPEQAIYEYNPTTQEALQVAVLPGIGIADSPLVQKNLDMVQVMGNDMCIFPGNILHFDLFTYELSWRNGTLPTDLHLENAKWTASGEGFLFAFNQTDGKYYVTQFIPSTGVHTLVATLPSTAGFRTEIISDNVYILGGGGEFSGGFGLFNTTTFESSFLPVQGYENGLTSQAFVFVEKLNRFYIFGGFDSNGGAIDEIYYVNL